MPVVIVENDTSQWNDQTGTVYHFPKRYRHILAAGVPVVYYKGKLRKSEFAPQRLSAEPHYFATATIGHVYPDPHSAKGDLLATLEDFRPFLKPVLNRNAQGEFFEQIPASRVTNYWRDGVREISQEVYDSIVRQSTLADIKVLNIHDLEADDYSLDALESYEEGQKTLRYVTTYERNAALRVQAIAIHGCQCAACGVEMGARYGKAAQGLIHVHHVVPISKYDGAKKVNPATDLIPVCPNCHAVIHHQKSKTLTVLQVRELLMTSERA